MVLSSASISTTSADAKPVDTSAGSGTTSSADAELEGPYLPSEQAALLREVGEQLQIFLRDFLAHEFPCC